jgi:hypothetical protein
MFLASGSLEMLALARQLGVGRATLYRWNWSREELLGEVLLSLALANLERAGADRGRAPGATRARAGPCARNLTSRCASCWMRTAASTWGLPGPWRTSSAARSGPPAGRPLGGDGLAAVVSRLSETLIFGDLIARPEPDAATPNGILRMMLGLVASSSRQRHAG